MALGDINIVAQVTETLTGLLSGFTVTLDSPADLKSDPGTYSKLNLYLYQVLENPFTKNLPAYAVDESTLVPPPLSLRLYYLLTPYASDPLSAHKVLGDAMQIFYDNGIITEDRLTEPLRLVTDKLSVVLLSTKLEDLTRIWNALQTPYRLSVGYEVRVVPIESARSEHVSRVTGRTQIYAQR